MKRILLIFGVLFIAGGFMNSFNIIHAEDMFDMIGQIIGCFMSALIGVSLVFISGMFYYSDLLDKKNEKEP